MTLKEFELCKKLTLNLSMKSLSVEILCDIFFLEKKAILLCTVLGSL